MFLDFTTAAFKAPPITTFEPVPPARPATSKLLPVNLSPEEIRDMVLEVLG